MRTHTKSAVLMTLLLALPTAGCAQTTSNETLPDTSVVEAAQNTESVRPGINDGFTNSDVDAAMWAERWTGESNETYALRHEILAALNLDPGDSVADIGAGTGLFVKLFAETVGDDGKVFAVDISQPFLDFIAENAAADGLENVDVVLGEDRASNLPDASANVVFHSNVYHHFEYPEDMTRDLARVLVDGGEMYVLDFERIEGVTPLRTFIHVRADKELVTAEIEAWGFELVEEVEIPSLERNYLLRFRKE